MNFSFLDITWGAPRAIMFLVVWVFACCLIAYKWYRHARRAQLLTSQFDKNILIGYSPLKNFFKALFFGVGFLFLCVVLMRPQWGRIEENIVQEGRDVLIALDISRSMLAGDCSPDRLTFAKEKIKKLLSYVECERVGVILFSANAFLYCPLTSDPSAVGMFLDAVTVEHVTSGSTDVSAPIETALAVFERMGTKKHKLLVLITDGEDFCEKLDGLSDPIQKAQLRVFTVGVGTETGAPIPLYDEYGTLKGHQKDSKNSVVISRLNTQLLYDLATKTGGQAVIASQDDSDIRTILHSIRGFEKERLEDKKVSRLQEQYPYFLAVSFICFLIEWLL